MNCPECKSEFKYNHDKPLIVLGVPALDSTIHYSILQQWGYLLENYRTIGLVLESTYVDMARNWLVTEGFKQARKRYGQEPDYFLFVDADSVIGRRDPTGNGLVQPRPELIDQLVARDLDAVSGYYVKKSDPYAQKPVWGRGRPVAQYVDPDPSSPLQECDWFGGGYLLVKSDVFRKIPGPWFENRNDGFGIKGAKIVGEDVYFCKKLQDYGYKLFVDLDVKIGHHGGTAWPPEFDFVRDVLKRSGTDGV